ncbi:AlbA family DNA-binding domain-containing protein [Actinoallomurus iriomotensis]|uniref:Schlafen AlbA-2 domain-containing protein n=1 Tax=Actinoallomurus iriomotensis TaxID=478107 RepID=A0A9W6S2E8_9ACTN|nr:hypothetical protein [Actinoallomurus iriomotensis]GLY85983.1 hypothetical protein Airi02_039120 [Actinoallomurus iriomotensis]
MVVVNPSDAHAALAAGEPGTLLGLPECGWLDAKSGIYQLNAPGGAEEFSKDVAGFANVRTGGLIVVGYRTRREADQEILDSLRPIPRTLVDLDQHRKLIRQRVTPAVRDVEVDWVDCGNERGLLYVYVPAQPPTSLPFVVPAPTGGKGATTVTASVAVPIREGDATVWLPRAELQRLLALGWAAAGGPSQEILDAMDMMVSQLRRDQNVRGPAHEVGAGLPGWQAIYRQSYGEMADRGVVIGTAVTDLHWDGPGVAQYFQAPQGQGWVLCALPDQRPVAVEETVWQALRAAARPVQGDGLSAVGYPVATPDRTLLIDPSTTRIELTGGSYGRGALTRASGAKWQWEPVPAFSMTMSRAARNWTANSPAPALRIRAVANLPWADTSGLTISLQRRQRLEESLPASPLAAVAVLLPTRRNVPPPTLTWQRGPNPNARGSLSYSTTITAPDGRKTVTAEVMMALPSALESSVVTCAELRLEDPDAWTDMLGTGGALNVRLTVEEVCETFIAAWDAALELLPLAVSDDFPQRPWLDPPTVELRICTDRHDTSPGPRPALGTLVDLSPLGDTDRHPVHEMAVTVTAPPVLAPDTRRELTYDAVAYMAEEFGYLSAQVTHR